MIVASSQPTNERALFNGVSSASVSKSLVFAASRASIPSSRSAPTRDVRKANVRDGSPSPPSAPGVASVVTSPRISLGPTLTPRRVTPGVCSICRNLPYGTDCVEESRLKRKLNPTNSPTTRITPMLENSHDLRRLGPDFLSIQPDFGYAGNLHETRWSKQSHTIGRIRHSVNGDSLATAAVPPICEFLGLFGFCESWTKSGVFGPIGNTNPLARRVVREDRIRLEPSKEREFCPPSPSASG